MTFTQPIGRWLLVTKNRPLGFRGGGGVEVSAVWRGWGDGKVNAGRALEVACLTPYQKLGGGRQCL
jgi:hypothetical protein